MTPNSFDLVLLDCHLPDGAGTALVYGILDQRDECPPIIAISAALDEDGVALLEAGVAAIWSKPVSTEQLKSISDFQLGTNAFRTSKGNAGKHEAKPAFADLQKLVRLVGVDAVEVVIESFFSASEARLPGLQGAVADNNFPELKRICHGWRGIAASLGATQLSDSIVGCEVAARTENAQECEQQLLIIMAEFDKTRANLAQFIQSHRSPRNKL